MHGALCPLKPCVSPVGPYLDILHVVRCFESPDVVHGALCPLKPRVGPVGPYLCILRAPMAGALRAPGASAFGARAGPIGAEGAFGAFGAFSDFLVPPKKLNLIYLITMSTSRLYSY